MAIVMEANYTKKLGLPGYSSHQYSVTLRTELNDVSQIEAESARLHAQLQNCVDREIQKTGWLPAANGNGHHPNGQTRNGNGQTPQDIWTCSPKQKDLILRIVEEQKLDKAVIERLAQERFGKSVKALNKMEASGLIEELFSTYGYQNGHGNGQRRFQSPPPQPANGR